MAPTTPYNDAPKRKRSRKKKSRTEIELSSSDESDGEQKRPDTPEFTVKKAKAPEETFATTSTTKSKKDKKRKTTPPAAIVQETPDISMIDAPASPITDHHTVPPQVAEAKVSPEEEDFASIYLRKITGELADDLDKVRGANDFTARSMPMLVHALRQGVSGFEAGERRRVVEAFKSN
ncbi:hypothetical protein P154DRAFT_528616 [Amniculicola lignicola CBS 123094]|uniref:Ribosome assembly protein 3 n=1 Tax=Amniculicola lignicola CBS 123094 TaxID=1392246 RepID=A0A6A5X4Y1_9PLEO|nr:hypothetical protein P154DRAFT_528616 [Amniculicola lignicola CBS 123094]